MVIYDAVITVNVKYLLNIVAILFKEVKSIRGSLKYDILNMRIKELTNHDANF